MRIFKNTWFARFASKEGVTDDELKKIVKDVLEKDLPDADLGSGVYKVRIARPGEGKSGGFVSASQNRSIKLAAHAT